MIKKLEICCYSAESAILAANAGANRIELCENFTEGGTTPSYATIKYVVGKLGIPVNVMLRPRGGDFLYTDMEFEIMKQDAQVMKDLGVNGIVFGILSKDAEIDLNRTNTLMELIHPLDCTFHRAFDMCKDQFKALEQLKKVGIKRILTSGGENTSVKGIDMITNLVKEAKNEIIIMPGSGVTPDTLEEIMHKTKAVEFHSSAKTFINTKMEHFKPNINMGIKNDIDEYKKISVDTDSIKDMIKILGI